MNSEYKKSFLILIFCFLIVLLLPQTSSAIGGAEAVKKGLDITAGTAGISTGETDLSVMVGRAVNYLFGVIGVIFLTVILIGGFFWMTAGGNEENIKKAKAFVINGINGMIVIFLAYALVYLILNALKAATTGGG